MEKQWFTLTDITYDSTIRLLSGNCIDGTYLGEMEVYLPDEVDDTILFVADTVRVYGGPGMTMSLPPQLMGVEKVEGELPDLTKGPDLGLPEEEEYPCPPEECTDCTEPAE